VSRRWLGVGLAVASALALVPVAAAVRDRNLAAALAYVHRQCPKSTVEVSTEEWMVGWRFNALYGNCLAGDGRDQHIWFFDGGSFVGADTREPFSSREIIGLWRDGDTMAFMYVLYRPSDPNCCPIGGGKIVRFRLRGEHVVRLDPLPRNR
jgi:hypothetical protein